MEQSERSSEISMQELAALVETAGGQAVGMMIQNRPTPDPRSFIGDGKVAELKEFIEMNNCDLAVFDNELSPSQMRVLGEELGVKVLDRSGLILDIFAQRAQTREGQLQVELAQNRYRLPRLAGMGINLSRLGGGIGTRGPGETKLETDKRHIRSRIGYLEAELKEITVRRENQRRRRKKDGVLTAAIVGYTNVGKSTLLNALTDAGVLAENKLFATLETTSRAILLPDGRSVTLIDTVGLISRLPHHLVEAFKSTLEEAANADVILHIMDASSEYAETEKNVTEELLHDLGCEGIPVVTVMNKCDLLPEGVSAPENTVMISAKNKVGFDELLRAISSALPETAKRMKLKIPFAQAGLIAKIREDGNVFSEEYEADGIAVDALVDVKLIKACEDYEV